MELIIYSPTENDFIKNVEFNHEEIKLYLTEALKKFEGIIYTDDTIKNAKEDRASLNKFKEAIENKRKEVKKNCLKPYEEFEAKIKEITALIDCPILAIDGQVKAFEEEQRAAKTEKIQTIYGALVSPDLFKIIPLQNLFDPRWLNVTYTLKNIENEIGERAEKVAADLKIIGDLKSEFDMQIKDVYLKTLDLSAALREKTRQEERKVQLAEYEQKQIEKRVEEVGIIPEEQIETPKETKPELETIDFRVWATKKQLTDLKEFLNINNIKYGKVPSLEGRN